MPQLIVASVERKRVGDAFSFLTDLGGKKNQPTVTTQRAPTALLEALVIIPYHVFQIQGICVR